MRLDSFRQTVPRSPLIWLSNAWIYPCCSSCQSRLWGHNIRIRAAKPRRIRPRIWNIRHPQHRFFPTSRLRHKAIVAEAGVDAWTCTLKWKEESFMPATDVRVEWLARVKCGVWVLVENWMNWSMIIIQLLLSSFKKKRRFYVGCFMSALS